MLSYMYILHILKGESRTKSWTSCLRKSSVYYDVAYQASKSVYIMLYRHGVSLVVGTASTSRVRLLMVVVGPRRGLTMRSCS